MEFLIPFLLMLIPLWFIVSLVRLMKHQQNVSAATETHEKRTAVRNRNTALISLLLATAVLVFIMFVVVNIATIQC